MKRIISITLALLVMLCLPLTANAAPQSGDLTYWNSDDGMVICVRWDVEQPSVKFTDPNGQTYDPTVEKDGTVASVMGNALYYFVETPAKGRWKYSYEQGTNTKVEVFVQENETPLEVESFTIDPVSGDSLTAKFRVTGPKDQWIQYRISAVVDGKDGEKELTSGSASTDQDVTATVDLSRLTSYNNYKLKLYVYYNSNGSELSDTAYSDSFSYTNSAQDNRAPNFSVTIRPDEYLLLVDWKDADTWYIDSILVAVIEDGGEPNFDTYEPGRVSSIELSYAPTTKVVEVEMSAKVNGVSTTPVRKTMNVADMAISCPGEDAINYVNYPVTYTNINKVMATMTVNEVATEYQLSGSGILNVQLKDSWNNLSMNYTDDNGVIWQINRKVFVDRTAPILSMSQNYDGMAVQGNKLVIGGSVKDGTQVAINGETVELSADGLFSKELTLKSGENIVSVSAMDGLGNEARYTAKVYSGERPASAGEQNGQAGAAGGFAAKILDGNSYWALLASGILAVLVIVYGVIFWRKEKKKDETV